MSRTPGKLSRCGDIIGGDYCPIAKIFSGKWGDNYPSIRLVGPSLDLKAEAYMEQITYGEIPIEVAEANAKFIKKAWNCHDQLVEVLDAMRAYCIPGMNWTDEVGQALLDLADKALAAVKEG